MTTVDPFTFEVKHEPKKPFKVRFKKFSSITSGAVNSTLDVEALWEYLGPLKQEHYVPNLDRVMEAIAENKNDKKTKGHSLKS